MDKSVSFIKDGGPPRDRGFLIDPAAFLKRGVIPDGKSDNIGLWGGCVWF
jgi:hypothetical protein